tara:strand:- start:1567 stop:2307 length:741 start_codon:yes stop_codon:yes gene_type:complete
MTNPNIEITEISTVTKFIFFSTLFTYNFHRFVRLKKLNPVKKKWIQSNKWILECITTISMIFAIKLFFELNNTTKLVILFIGIISLSYPYVIRRIPYIKVFVIAFVWTIVSCLIEGLENNIEIDLAYLLQILARFCFIISITIPFDIRDLKVDKKTIRTIPMIFGEDKSILFSKNLLIASVFLYLLLYYLNNIEIIHLCSLIFGSFFTLAILMKVSNKKNDIFYSFWLESSSLVVYIILFISSWIP